MTCDISARKLRPIKIAVPDGVKDTYQAPDALFEGTRVIDGAPHDLLLIHPDTVGGWRPTFTREESAGLSNKFNGALQVPSFKEFEVEVSCKVSIPAYYILQHLEESQARGSGLVTLLDYITPARADYVVALAGDGNPYTVRRGEIYMGDAAGIVGMSGGPFSVLEGVKFTFKEAGLR